MGPIHFLFGVETSKVGSVTDKWDLFIIFLFSSPLSPYPPVPTAARTRPQPASTASCADDASSVARHPARQAWPRAARRLLLRGGRAGPRARAPTGGGARRGRAPWRQGRSSPGPGTQGRSSAPMAARGACGSLSRRISTSEARRTSVAHGPPPRRPPPRPTTAFSLLFSASLFFPTARARGSSHLG